MIFRPGIIKKLKYAPGVLLIAPFFADMATGYRHNIVEGLAEAFSRPVRDALADIASLPAKAVHSDINSEKRAEIIERGDIPHALYRAGQLLLSYTSYGKTLPVKRYAISMYVPFSTRTVDRLNAALGLPATFKDIAPQGPLSLDSTTLLNKYESSFYWIMDTRSPSSAVLIVDLAHGGNVQQNWNKLCATVQGIYNFPPNQQQSDPWLPAAQIAYLQDNAAEQLDVKMNTLRVLTSTRVKSKWMNMEYYAAATNLKYTNIQIMNLGGKPIVPQQDSQEAEPLVPYF